MPRSKKGKVPKKKFKTIHEIDSGKKRAEATEEEKTTTEKLNNQNLVWFVETIDLKNMMKKQSLNVRLLADLIDQMFGNPTKSSKSFDSPINASKARKELHPLIITKIIANIESLQALSLKENSKVKNIPDVIY